MLVMVGGDIGKFKNQLLSLRDVTKDSDIALGSWASSLEKTKNSLTRLQGAFYTFLDTGGKGFLDFLSSSLNSMSDLSEKTPGLATGMVSFAGSMIIGATSASKLKNAMESLKLASVAAGSASTKAFIGAKLLNPWILGITAVSAGIGIMVKRYIELAKAERDAMEKAITYDNNTAKSMYEINVMGDTKLKLHESINNQLQEEASNWRNIKGFIQEGAKSLEDYYKGITKSDLDITFNRTKEGTREKSVEDKVLSEMIRMQQKRIDTMLSEKNINQDALNTEKKKLAIMKNNMSMGNKTLESLAKIKESRISMLKLSKSEQTPEVKTEMESIRKENLASFDIAKSNLPEEFKKMAEVVGMSFEEMFEDMNLSAEQFTEKYSKRIIEASTKNRYKGELSATGTDYGFGVRENEEQKKNDAIKKYYDKWFEIEKDAETKRQVVIEQSKLQVEEMNRNNLEFQKAVGMMVQIQGSLTDNIRKSQMSILRKRNIKSVEGLHSELSSIGKKEDADYIINALKEITINGKKIAEQDIMRLTNYGQDFSAIDKLMAQKEVMSAFQGMEKEYLGRNKSLFESSIGKEAYASKIEEFRTTEDAEVREKIHKELLERLSKEEWFNDQYMKELQLGLKSVEIQGLIDKEQQIALQDKLTITQKILDENSFQLKMNHNINNNFLRKIEEAEGDTAKLVAERAKLEYELNFAKKQQLMTSVSSNKALEEIAKRIGEEGLVAEEFKKTLGVSKIDSSVLTNELIKKFDNISTKELEQLYGTTVSTSITMYLGKVREILARREDADNKLAEKERENIRQVQKEIENRKKINLRMIERQGEYTKAQYRASELRISGGEQFGFDKLTEYRITQIDTEVINRKIEYLKSQKQTTEIQEEIADLAQKGYELELEQYKRKQTAIKEVSNFALSNVVNAATTGEFLRPDSQAMISGFGNIMATILGGNAPEIPEQALDVAKLQLDELKKINDGIRESNPDKSKNKEGISIGESISNTISESFAKGDFLDNFMNANTIKDKFSVIGDSISGAFSEFSSSWKGTNKDKSKNFSGVQKTEMILQGVEATIGIINSFTQAQQNAKLHELQTEQQILELRLQGATTEEEKLAIENEIYENKKRQIREEYKSKTQFMGMTGTTGAAAGGAVSGAMQGAMMGAAGGPAGMAIGAAIGGASGLISGWMGGNKAKIEAKQQEAMLKVQEDIRKLTEDQNKLIQANNTFMSTYGKYAGKVGISEGINAAFDAIKNTGEMSVGGTGIQTWSERKGSGKKKYTVEKSVQKTVGLEDIGMKMSEFNSLADTEEAILRTEKQIAHWRQIGGHEALATLRAYENMLANLKNIKDVHKSNIEVYKSYFGATLQEQKKGDMITGYKADWTDFRAELLKMSSSQAMAGMDADINKFTSNFFTGLTDAFVQNSSKLNSVITKNVIPAYELIANVLNGEYKNMQDFDIAYSEAFQKSQEAEKETENRLDNEQVKKSMELLIQATKKYKEEQDAVNKEVGKFEDMWVSAGGSISDILQSATQSTKDFYSALSTSIMSGSKAGLESLINSDALKAITEKNINQVLDKLSASIVEISNAAQEGSSDFDQIENAINKYLQLSDALGDFERYKKELKELGLTDEEISKLEYQLKLQDLLNGKIEERMTLSELASAKQSDAEKEISKYMTERYKIQKQIQEKENKLNKLKLVLTDEEKIKLQEEIDTLLSKDIPYITEKVNNALKESMEVNEALKEASKQFTEDWLNGIIEGDFDAVKSGLNDKTVNMIESIENAFSADSFEDMGSEIGSTIAENILSSYRKNLLNNKFKEQIAMINSQMMGVISSAEGGGLSILGAAQMSQSVQRLAVELEQERQKMSALESMFDYGRKINYDQTANQINYQTSSSKESVYNITNTNNFNVGTVVSKDYQMREFANTLAPYIEKAFRNLGVVIK